MKDNLLKILFSGTVLVLTFWGKESTPSFPNIQTAVVRSANEKKTASVQFKNEIYSFQSAALLTDQGVGEVSHRTNSTAPIVVQAGLFLIGDLEKDGNVAELNPQKRWPIASLSKLMTAVIALENIPGSDLVAISALAVRTEGVAGGFRDGDVFTANDLLKALMLVSSNDAAVALSEHLGRERFVNLMNAKAVALGMADTFFKEPSGLSPTDQSTVHDLKILVRYIYHVHPKIFSYSQLANIDIHEGKLQSQRVLKNINFLAGRPDFLGGKTGYTDDAGENLISLFSRNNKVLVVIVLDARDRFQETLSALRQYDSL